MALPTGLTEMIWQPLSGPYHTRVARLHPGKNDAPVVMDLLEIDLQADPEYDALSYTWGTRLARDSITVNGVLHPVKKNLHEALLVMREEIRPINLWIDALSICQVDEAEKSEHVQMIGHIFQQAKAVRAWVGHMDPDPKIDSF